MHLLLTDFLICPRCGPGFGLVLLGRRIEARRLLEGELGCPNCRESYPVREGFADLRPPPRSSLSPLPVLPDPPDEEETTRLAALLGVARGPGHLVLVGEPARHARQLASLVEDVEVVAVNDGLRGWKEEPGVSRVTAGSLLPFRSRRIRGVAVAGARGEEGLGEAARVVGPGSRLVVLDASRGARGRLEAKEGLTPILDEGGVVVAAREEGGVAPPRGAS